MNKAIFLDRDGTINVDFGYVYKTQELELLPGVAEALRIFQELGYLLIVITNQSGIGRKPSPFMVTEAMKKYEIDPSQSYMFGDKKSDTECGERSGVKSFRVTSEHSLLYWANQLKNNLL